MLEFLRTTPAQVVLWLAVLVAMLAVGFYLASLVRRRTRVPEPAKHELLTEFRDLHDGGTLSPEEFRRIKRVLDPGRPQRLDSGDSEGNG